MWVWGVGVGIWGNLKKGGRTGVLSKKRQDEELDKKGRMTSYVNKKSG